MLSRSRLVGLLLLAALTGTGRPAPAQATPFVPPGREDFVADMLGRDVELPSGCRFSGAVILRETIRARYDCAGTDGVIVVLSHVASSEDARARTEQFAIATQGPPCPPGLLAILEDRIRARESAWQWAGSQPLRPQPSAEDTGTPAVPAPPRTQDQAPTLPWTLMLGVAALVAAFLVHVQLGPQDKALGANTSRAGGAIRARLRNVWSRRRQDLLCAAALFALSLAARSALGSWGPFHANGQAPAWIMGAAWGVPTTLAYGPGYTEAFHFVAALLPSSPDYAIFACNALLSSLGPPLLYTVARQSGLGTSASLLAGALLAVDPAMLRVAATESYFPPILTLLLAARASLMTSARHYLARRLPLSVGFAAFAALLSAQAARIHPFAWLGVASVALGVIAVPRAPSPRHRALLFATGTAIVGIATFATSWGWLREVAAMLSRRAPEVGAILLDWSSLADPFVLLGIVVLLVGLAFDRARWVVLPALVELVALALTRHIYAQNPQQAAVFQRIFLPGVVVGAIAVFPPRWFNLTSLRVLAGLAVACVPVAFMAFLRERTTEHLEYAWLRHQFRTLEPNAIVLHVERVGDRILYLPEYAAPGRSAQHRLAMASSPGLNLLPFLPDGLPVYVLRSSLCSSADARAQCDRLEQGVRLQPVARASFPARPTHPFQPYDGEPVEIVLSRVMPNAPR